jgi:hypothetical protein
MTVRHLNPYDPNAIEHNERVVFGRIVFIAHSEETGEVSFPPVGLGLVHVETGRRANRAVIYDKPVTTEHESDIPMTHKLSHGPWFENDGTFFWELPEGSYQIDALGCALSTKVSAQDLTQPKVKISLPLRPGKPPMCGFAVNPNIVFDVSGDSGALYVGSLLIDMDIGTQRGIEIININRIEIKDEYAEAMELFRSRYPSCALTSEKKLMTSIPDRLASFANRRCPTWIEMLLGAILGVAILVGPALFIGPVSLMTPIVFYIAVLLFISNRQSSDSASCAQRIHAVIAGTEAVLVDR